MEDVDELFAPLVPKVPQILQHVTLHARVSARSASQKRVPYGADGVVTAQPRAGLQRGDACAAHQLVRRESGVGERMHGGNDVTEGV